MMKKSRTNLSPKIQQMNKSDNVKDMDQEDIITPIVMHSKVSTPEAIEFMS